MKKLSLFSVLSLFIASLTATNAQELTQVIRGLVIDAESQSPVAFASIAVITTNPTIGTISDDNGYFRLEKVPVGRHNIQVSFVGYETQLIPELMVTTGKEIVLSVKLKEQITHMEEVVVKAYTKKDKPLNSMATLSARAFSVEEARRYAGGFDDPGRLASSFAGVTTENLRDNSIVIRGNSPKGLLWRLEGIEIPNPNHFANMETFGGGGISSLSALVVGNSDFYTGAFPAEYGNAVSGVFDINLRAGNNEKREYALQLGTMGIDISSEGPLKKDSRASYLFNYRYSTMGLVKYIFPPEIKDFIPVYQDLCFKINMPTQKSGVFSIWGLASDDFQTGKAKEDSTEWKMEDDKMDFDITQRLGGIGFNHRYIFPRNAYVNTSLALTGDVMQYNTEILDSDLILQENEDINPINYKYTFTSVLNYKYNAKIALRTGFVIDNIHYNTLIKHAPAPGQDLLTVIDEKGASNMVQYFVQSKLNVTEQLAINSGLHGHYFTLNNETVIEPRIGLTYNLTKSQSVSFAYGKHSRLEPLTLYFASIDDGNNKIYPNKKLKIAKSHHLVFAYDLSINPNLRLKIEPYIQFIEDVPVIPDSNFSTLNLDADWYFNNKLINTGTGKNIGIDITLERFLNNGFYYLATASVFDSKYKGDDGIERNTRFNRNYVFNVLLGKEWIYGQQKNRIFGLNLKLNYFGGKRYSPVNMAQSIIAKDVVYDYSHLFEDKEADNLHVNTTINYRVNKTKHSSIWSLQIMNLFLSKENYGMYYDYKTNQVKRWEFAVMLPNISYKIEF